MSDTKSILIVEDEKPLAHALQLKLEHEGYTVTLATNGQEALDLLQTRTFFVMLLDLMMPVMDGFQVLERLKAIASKPVVFVLSNLSQQEDEQRVLALGARKFFIKSDTPLTEIVGAIQTIN